MSRPSSTAVRWAVSAALALATGAAAATKPAEVIVSGNGPATLTLAERAKAVAHGIALETPPAAAAYASVPPLSLRVEARPIGLRPHDAGVVREVRP